MKKLKCLIIALLIGIYFIPNVAYAEGSVRISPKELEIIKGKSVSFTITANKVAGKFDISSSNSAIATLSESSVFLDGLERDDVVTINVTAKEVGTTTIKITNTDVTSLDDQDLSGAYTTISVNVIANSSTPSVPDKPSTPTEPDTPSTPTEPDTPSTPAEPDKPSGIEDNHIIKSQSGEEIYNSLLNTSKDYKFTVDKYTENPSAFLNGLYENASKSVADKVIIDIYKFNLGSQTEELPGGNYKIRIPISDKIKNYDRLEIVELDSLGNKTSRKISLNKEGNYLVFEIAKEDLGVTNFALIGYLMSQVDSGSALNIIAFVCLAGILGYVVYMIKKKRKLFSI